MFNAITNLLTKPFIANIITRLGNRWTAHGISLVILALSQQGVLPDNANSLIDGLPLSKIIPWLVVAIGIYFIGKMPSKADRLRNKADTLRTQIEIAQLERELKGLENNKGDE